MDLPASVCMPVVFTNIENLNSVKRPFWKIGFWKMSILKNGILEKGGSLFKWVWFAWKTCLLFTEKPRKSGEEVKSMTGGQIRVCPDLIWTNGHHKFSPLPQFIILLSSLNLTSVESSFLLGVWQPTWSHLKSLIAMSTVFQFFLY